MRGPASQKDIDHGFVRAGRRSLGRLGPKQVGQRKRTGPHSERPNPQEASAGEPVTVSAMVLTEKCQHFTCSSKAEANSDLKCAASLSVRPQSSIHHDNFI